MEEFIPFLDYDVNTASPVFYQRSESLNALPAGGAGHVDTSRTNSQHSRRSTWSPLPGSQGTGQTKWAVRWKPALNALASFADRMPAAEERPKKIETPLTPNVDSPGRRGGSWVFDPGIQRRPPPS